MLRHDRSSFVHRLAGCLVVVATFVAPAVHWAVEPHAWCAAHGRWIDGHSHDGDAAADASPADRAVETGAALHHGPTCRVQLLPPPVRETAPPRNAAAFVLAPSERRRARPGALLRPARLAAFRIAPKQSPPCERSSLC